MLPPPSRRWTHVSDTLSGPVFGWRYSRRDPRLRALVKAHEAAREKALADYDAGRISREQVSAVLRVSVDEQITAAVEAAETRKEAA